MFEGVLLGVPPRNDGLKTQQGVAQAVITRHEDRILRFPLRLALADRLQDHHDGSQRHLVLQCQDTEGVPSLIRFGNAVTTNRGCAVATGLDQVEEVQKAGLRYF